MSEVFEFESAVSKEINAHRIFPEVVNFARPFPEPERLNRTVLGPQGTDPGSASLTAGEILQAHSRPLNRGISHTLDYVELVPFDFASYIFSCAVSMNRCLLTPLSSLQR